MDTEYNDLRFPGNKYLSGAGELPAGTIATQVVSEIEVDLDGAQVGDIVVASAGVGVPSGLVWSACVKTENVVTISVANPTSGSVVTGEDPIPFSVAILR